ncbi:MAG: peptidylprolyl isomerase [Syntrophobacteraceae bacterium]|nr:peptidylprolyl isomerase [Desulfobacteraceae bacterium]
MDIAKDRMVILEYTVRLPDGSYVKGENGPVSLNFVAGYEQILPALEARLLGLEQGQETEFVIPAAEAFGEHDESQVMEKTFEEFPEGRTLQAGRWAVATNTETQAQYGYFVKKRNEESVVLDFNHPLAGKDLHYRVKVVHVRAASGEELEYLRPCEHAEDAEASPPPAS